MCSFKPDLMTYCKLSFELVSTRFRYGEGCDQFALVLMRSDYIIKSREDVSINSGVELSFPECTAAYKYGRPRLHFPEHF